MNINDIKENTEKIQNVWAEIFSKQNEVALKYSDIEGMGNLLNTTATNIDTKEGQKWIKDFAWRTTEELAEADEAYLLYKANNKSKDSDEFTHYIEELIDALHFLTELTIIAGYDYKVVSEVPICICELNKEYTPWNVVYELGLMCNTLKNKPWKQSQMLTDRAKFELYLKSAWREMHLLFASEDMKLQDIYDFYFKKNEVNKFRIRSKY